MSVCEEVGTGNRQNEKQAMHRVTSKGMKKKARRLKETLDAGKEKLEFLWGFSLSKTFPFEK